MVSPIAVLQERERQTYASDYNFFRRMLRFFELRVPADRSPSPGASFFFPLVLPPESEGMDEPFTVEATPTQGGGLYVEEDGIVQRMIRISGTTGFRPRALPNTSVTGLAALSPEKRSFGRRLRTRILTELSGQKHFQYLQDSVFRVYGDLKRDPATAEDTKLIYHNPKDEESWLVVPRQFSLRREKSDRILYRYQIELLVVDAAQNVDKDFSEDRELLDVIKDPLRFVSSGLDLAQGAVNDLTALTDELQGVVRNVSTILDNGLSVLNAVADFVRGTTLQVEAPYDRVLAVTEDIEDALDSIERATASGQVSREIPLPVLEKLRELADGMDRIGAHPSVFETPTHAQLRQLREQQELLRTISTDRANEALETSPPSTFAQVEGLGTAVTAGDVTSAGSELGIGRRVNEYVGAVSRPVAEGDSLVGLAARYLGDARLWTHVARLNGLRPPFLFEQADADVTLEESPFSGVINRGESILIPTYAKPPTSMPLLPVLGVPTTASAEEQLLGTDVAVEPVAGRPGAWIYGIPVDAEGGSTGPKTVAGLAAVAQAVRLRVATERGTDVLFRRAGVGRVVGGNLLPVETEASRYKIAEAIDQDSRIASVRKVDQEQGISPDIVQTDIEIELRGFTETYNVRAAD